MDRTFSLYAPSKGADQEPSMTEFAVKPSDSASTFQVDLKIVSGGQTGVDQAALQVAIDLGIPHGGWCPKGRRCEFGTIPDQFLLSETGSPRYSDRTEQNVVDSDATLIVFRGSLSGGTSLTQKLAARYHKPHLMIDLLADPAVENVGSWLASIAPSVLNVAGPRESTSPGIFDQTRSYLSRVFRNLKNHENIIE